MGITEKEMAACVFGVNQFKHNIYGTHFKLISDHKPLKYLMSIKDVTGKLARWSIFLSQFDFELLHREGKSHCNTDFCSRPILLSNSLHDDEHKSQDPFNNGALMYYLEYKKFKRGTARRQINKVTKLAEIYKLENRILSKIKNDKLLIVPKPSERVELIDKYHAARAHFGIESTANRLKERF